MSVQDIVDAALSRGNAGAPPPRPPEEPPRRRRPRRKRLVSGRVAGAGVLVVCLLGAWIAVRRFDGEQTPHAQPSATTVDLTARVGSPDDCTQTGAQLQCAIPNGQVTYTFPADVAGSYRRVTGIDDGVAAR